MMRNPLLNKHMPALNLFFFTVKKNLPLMLLALAVMALVNPGLIITQIVDTLDSIGFKQPYDMTDVVTVVGVGTTVTTSLMAMLLCLINFSYLYKKSASDVYHALPVSRTKLLLARFFGSIVPALAPMLLSYISLSCMGFIDRVTVNVGDVWLHALTNVAILLLCAAFTMIFLVCAGNTFSFFASIIGVNISIPIIVYIGMSLCENYLFGFVQDETIVYNCTPVLYAFSQYRFLGEADGWTSILWSLPVILLLTLVCLGVSILLYNRRKSEKSGETYAFKFVYYIVAVLLAFIGAFAVGYIFSEGDFDLAFWVFGLAGGILTAIAFGAITDKGFKTVKRSVILGGCAYVIMLLFTFGIILDITGYEQRVPAVEDVKSVTIDDSRHSMSDLVLDDATTAVALHQSFIDNHHSEYDEHVGRITLEYTLKNGSTVAREYVLSSEKEYDEYLAMVSSDSYRKAVTEVLNELYAPHILERSFSIETYCYNELTNEDDTYTLTLDDAQLAEFLELYFRELAVADRRGLTGYAGGMRTNYYLNGSGLSAGNSHSSGSYDYRSFYMHLIISPTMTETNQYLAALKLDMDLAKVEG